MENHHDMCHHCGLPIPAGVDIRDRVDEQEVFFCCHGCHGAFLIITGSGLGRFYRQRSWDESGYPDGVYETDFDEESLKSHVVHLNESEAEISLLVDGIRCASCVWLLEKILQDQEGVEDARVNYGSHRARIRFSPAEISPKSLFNSISRLGYLPRPYSRNAIQESAAREQKTLLIRFGTAAFLSMQLMGYSLALYAGYFQGIDPAIRKIIQYFAAAVTTPVVFYSGWPFLSGGFRSLLNRLPNMDLLIALGVVTAYVYSLWALFIGGEVYFDTAAMIITLILLGRLLENSARNRSMSGIDRLMQLAPDIARQTDGEKTWSVESAQLKPGDRIVVLPGERIPVDAVIFSGKSEFDESTVTGEALPVCRTKGEAVTSGSLNLTNAITLKVTRIRAESFIARMNRMVEEAQNRKAPVQSLADRIAAFFVPAVIIMALATWSFWTTLHPGTTAAMLNAVSVLVVACPCALGLATPTAVLVATGQAATAGILFRGGDIIESVSRADLVAFDKTGTLTIGKPVVSALYPAADIAPDLLSRSAAQVAAGSNHPLARAITDDARQHHLSLATLPGTETVPGKGLNAQAAGVHYRLGSRTFLQENGIDIPDLPQHQQTEVHLAVDGNYYGYFLFSDPLRPEAAEAIAALHHIGIDTVLLTGDQAGPTLEVVKKTGIDNFHTGLKPSDKADWIRQVQGSGRVVIMVGDGINDAPALSQADAGCAMAGGTDIALETSDLVLTRPDLLRLVESVLLSRKTLTTIRQNLFWAFSYNLVAIPLAATGRLAPIWAAVAMATSSILVIGNSLRLGHLLKK